MSNMRAVLPDRWSEAELGDLVKFKSGGTPNRETEAFWGGELPWVTARDLKVFELSNALQSLSSEGAVEAKIAPKGALLVLVRGMTLFRDFPVAILQREMSFNQDIKALIASEIIDPHFLGQQLTAKKRWVMRLVDSAGHGTGRLDSDQLKSLVISFPSLPEQKKIAAFLGVVDAKIAALRARRDGLERYKRGLMQALFSQTLRFTRPDGTAFPDWEEKRLGEVFERVTRKNVVDNQNVLTISAQQGLVNQRDYFNKSVSAQDVSGYFLLHKGDFAYNKSYSKGYPMGAIKRLNLYDRGVVSTLYICFRSKNEQTARYFEQFFEFGGLNREMQKIAQEGARNHGLLNMSVVEFFKDMNVPFPHPDEQQKIADALSAIDAKIAAVADQVAQMEAFKKGLLQQMFV